MIYILYIMITIAGYKVLSILWHIIQGKGEKRKPVSHSRYLDRKSTRLNSSHVRISYAVFCLKKKRPSSHPPPAIKRPSLHQSHLNHRHLHSFPTRRSSDLSQKEQFEESIS